MEQRRMRIGAVPGPSEAGLPDQRGRGVVVPSPSRPPEGAARPGTRPAGARPPGRLTAIGTGVVAVGGTMLGAAVDSWLLGGPGVLFGVVYLATCFQVAVRVRSADLMAAPISGPIAFALALLVCGPSSGRGMSGVVVGLATGLAVQAGWLFAGTGLAVVIVLARHIALRRRRRAGRR